MALDDNRSPPESFVRSFEERLKQDTADMTTRKEPNNLPANIARTPAPAPRHEMQTPLQIIASGIKRLVWDDSEKLGEMIATHLNREEPGERASGSTMSKAVQAAADDIMKEGGG